MRIYVLSYRLVGRWDDKMRIPRPTGYFYKVKVVKWIHDYLQVPLRKLIWSNAYTTTFRYPWKVNLVKWVYDDFQKPLTSQSGQMSRRRPTGTLKKVNLAKWVNVDLQVRWKSIWTNEYTTTFMPFKKSIWLNAYATTYRNH